MNKVSGVVLGVLVAVGLGGLVVYAANPAGSLDQCANGPVSSPEQCTGSAWQNGNLNQNQAHYAEGQSVPFRIVLTDVPTSGVNTLIIEYDIRHSDTHAYDYLTSYDRTETSADPCSGISPCALSATAPIPAPSSSGSPVAGMPTDSFNSLPASERVMSLFNGSPAGTGITYVSEGDLTASQSSTQVQIQFEASSPTVVFAWGGHIASSLDWGAGNAASQINGSPYHMRFMGLNGEGGNQDRSLSARAVLSGDSSSDDAPQLVVNKVVINDNGGTNVTSDFQLFLDGVGVTSGVPTTTTEGAHTVSETTDPDYEATIGGDCAADGTVTLAMGDVKTCTITNDDIAQTTTSSEPPVPPLIDLVKVPSPSNLPGGPGTVEYTYTLRNNGTVPVTDITMVGDTCSPITLISGDANADSILDVDETWTYTCSATLSETHTNIITATGWANGISATDTANATVVVGVPVVPPLIHVTKVPSPLVLPAGGGEVIYTYKATNLGTVTLSHVSLTDDTCSPVEYVSGDTNGDAKLDTTETWTYTCSAHLVKNTVNTVIASGEANGLISRDSAITPVVVSTAVPKLPATGLPPGEKNIPWNIILLAGILAIFTSRYFARRKQTASF